MGVTNSTSHNSTIANSTSPTCEICGKTGQLVSTHYYQAIGLVAIRLTSQVKGKICLDCEEYYFWEYTSNTASSGWLGLISFVTNFFHLPNNLLWRYNTSVQKKRLGTAANFVSTPDIIFCPSCNESSKLESKRVTVFKWLSLAVSAGFIFIGVANILSFRNRNPTLLDGLITVLCTLPMGMNLIAMSKLLPFKLYTCWVCKHEWPVRLTNN